MVLPVAGYGVYGFGYGVGKADPRVTRFKPYLNTDGLSLTPRQKKANEDACTQGSQQTFNPSIKSEGNLETYF